MQKISFTLLALLGMVSLPAQATDPVVSQFVSQFNVAATLASDYLQEARKTDKEAMLSADEGRAFYTKRVVVDGKELACSKCHTDNPTKEGKHAETGKPIKPVAVSANPESFSDVKKVEKNFAKHCRELYGKDCAAIDKANFLTYMLTVR